MPATRITNFGGVLPILANRRLPGEAAREAANVNLLPGELRPMRKPRKVWAPAVADGLRSFYRVDDATWFGWPTEYVRMEASPLEGEARFPYTGDGVPKITTKALGTPARLDGTPLLSRTLGIPTPQTKPTVTPTGGVGAVITRFYVYTFYSDWNEESAPSPVSVLTNGKIDGNWAITNMDDAPPNGGNVTAAVAAGGFVTVTHSAPHFLRAKDDVSYAAVGGMTDLNGTWKVAEVVDSLKVKIALNTVQVYTAGGTWARVNPWGTCKKRLYRTSGNLASFQLVADGITTTNFNDALTDAQILGDELISNGWVPPPVDLSGLVALPGGVLAGFIAGGKTVCFSEPYQPHAWPTGYQVKVTDLIVGIAAFDTNVAVATQGVPVVLSGIQPGQMTPLRFPKPMPALSRASVCSIATGVVYASKNGMVHVDLAGATLFTSGLFTPEGWNSLGPATMISAFDGSRLLVSTTSNKRVYVLDASSGGGQMVTVAQAMDGARADAVTGDLYFAFGKAVYRFDSFDTAPMVMDWWSHEYQIAKPDNMGAAKVEVDAVYSAEAQAALQVERGEVSAANATIMASPLGGRGAFALRAICRTRIAGSILSVLPDPSVMVSFSLYVGEKLVYAATVPTEKVFRLPGGYRSDVFSVRVQGNTQIRSVVIGDTPKALAMA